MGGEFDLNLHMSNFNPNRLGKSLFLMYFCGNRIWVLFGFYLVFASFFRNLPLHVFFEDNGSVPDFFFDFKPECQFFCRFSNRT